MQAFAVRVLSMHLVLFCVSFFWGLLIPDFLPREIGRILKSTSGNISIGHAATGHLEALAAKVF